MATEPEESRDAVRRVKEEGDAANASTDNEPQLAKAFAQVRKEECAWIEFVSGRTSAPPDARSSKKSTEVVTPESGSPKYIGLALSGGGIRSATFSLGVLQALADQNRLRHIDYLSTVSGGGYIGSWLSAWISRAPAATAQAKLELVEAELARSAHRSEQEPREVQWLRRYSNYLTPRVGVLSSDALTVAAIWMRNVFLNALILTALTTAVLLVPVLIVPFIGWLIAGGETPETAGAPPHIWIAALIAVACGAYSIGIISRHLTLASPPILAVDKIRKKLEFRQVMSHVIVPAFVAAVFGSVWLIGENFDAPGPAFSWFFGVFGNPCPPCTWTWLPAWIDGYRFGIFDAVLGLSALGVSAVYFWLRALRETRKAHAPSPLVGGDKRTYILALIVSVAISAALLGLWTSRWNVYRTARVEPWLFGDANFVVPILTFASPLMMVVFGVCGSLWVGLVGRAYQERSREWWARMNGWHIFIGLAWLAVCLLTFYVPPVVAYVHDQSRAWISAAAGATWLGSLLGAFFGKNLAVRPDSSAGRWKGIALAVATAIVAVGIFVALATMLGYVLGRVVDAPFPDRAHFTEYVDAYYRRIDLIIYAYNGNVQGWWLLLLAEAALVVAALGLAWRVDINRFSLHNMYKNRLTRCYLGASNHPRHPQPFTGFDSKDDMPLNALKGQRPLHVINTALNLVQGKELAWQQRKAASFVLTPLYCGFDLSRQQSDEKSNAADWLGFRPTDQYASRDPGREDVGFSLGMAVATSGAAASPNMGFQSTPALAVIMTFFDVRIGRWSPNPAKEKWQDASPKIGIAYLLAELAGLTNESRDFVYLSDGGHFDNTGVYELVRRKCRLIVMVDAGADPRREFADLANLQRKVRVDFGYEIELPLEHLRNTGDLNLAGAGFASGTVHYSATEKGTIIYIKPSMCAARKESADLQNYRAEHLEFPQQSTADQWFDESQFESYRKLGFELGVACLKEHADRFADVRSAS